ncbi:MAG: hypothetical protein ACI8W8_003039 [Rhodothermales bacterium]|jgi:hypothetical protein
MKHLLLIGLLSGSLCIAANHRNSDPRLVGFNGQVQGKVVEGQKKNAFMFKVSQIVRIWKNNEARDPKLLVGMTVPVAPSWRKGENGRWQPVEHHLRFIKSVRIGESLTLELKHAEHEFFAILELSAEQRARGGAGEEPAERKEHREREEPAHADDEQSKDAEIRALRHELERLRAENHELRKR